MLTPPISVVFIDDDAQLHRAVGRILDKFRPVSAYSGPEGLALVDEANLAGAPFAVVVCDVEMPGWNGFETLQRIWEVTPDVQAVICTGADLDWDDIQERYPACDSLLVIKKPFSRIELLQSVQMLAMKWCLEREVRRHVVELEATVAARTAQLVEANRRLGAEMEWRARMESEHRLSQRLEAVGSLAAGIAHEINNPIQYVGDNLAFVRESATDLLAAVVQVKAMLGAAAGSGVAAHELALVLDSIDVGYVARELPAAVESIQGGIQRISSVVGAMKELSHPGQREARGADINHALDSALAISASSYRAIADVDKQLERLPMVTCFISELGQVFLNLIVNAAHAMESRAGERGRLGVGTRVDGGDVVITISDTGCGIPLDIQDRIFDPFFTTKDIGRGTGQGLAIARSIVVDRHRGALSFSSVVGEGTTFTIRLPVEQATRVAA